MQEFNLQVMKNIRISLIDDHKLFRDGIKLILNAVPNFEVISEHNNGKEFIEEIHSLNPDVVLTDIDMPVMDGEQTTIEIKKLAPHIKVLTMSMHSDEEYYHRMINAGVKGFIIKESSSSELIEAVEKVANNENYFSQELMRRIIYNFSSKEKQVLKNNKIEISKREIEVLVLICKGLTNIEISEELHISQRTVEGHRSKLLRKTGSRNTTNLIMYAVKNGLVELDDG